LTKSSDSAAARAAKFLGAAVYQMLVFRRHICRPSNNNIRDKNGGILQQNIEKTNVFPLQKLI
jgi:hypothetical protein